MPEEAIIRRQMPYSQEAEAAVIGSMIIDIECISIVGDIITGEDFYNKEYGIIYDAMCELYKEQRQVDPVTLLDRLKEKDTVRTIDNMDFLSEIVSSVPTSANAKYYAEIIAEKSTLRKLIKLMWDIENKCFSGKENITDVLEFTEKNVFDLIQKKETSDFTPISQVVINAVNRIEAAYRAGGTITGIASGFYDLDYLTSGFQPSDLVLIAARPSMGKTAFVLNIAQHMAFRDNKSVVIFSLEMSKILMQFR